MKQPLYRVLHAYHPDNSLPLELTNIFIYRDSLVLVGYQSIGSVFSSFVHYQFESLPIADIYATQIQMIEEGIPTAFRNANKKVVYHTEPTFAIIPKGEMEGMNGYEIYNQLHSNSGEKILNTELSTINSFEYYNFPFRVYNDAANAFENAEFNSYHSATIHAFSEKSIEKKILYISIKTQFIEFTGFYNGHLMFLNSFPYKNKADLQFLISAILKDLKISAEEDSILATTIRKEEKESIFEAIEEIIPTVNRDQTNLFGCENKFWELYGDIYLVQKYS